MLSKQTYYDWGLRVIKSVLVVPGKFKRAEPELPEDCLLMRALGDFNIPKISTQDLFVFFGFFQIYSQVSILLEKEIWISKKLLKMFVLKVK